MKLIEAEKAKDVIHEYFKSLMAKDASGTDVYKLAVGIVSCLEHDANLLKAIDELPSAEPDTTTHDSIPAETGKNDGDRTSGDCISRQQAIDALKEKVFHNLSDEFYGAMQVLDELPSVQPERKDAVEKAVAVEAISDELMSRFDISATYAYEIAEKAMNRIEAMAKELERGEQDDTD